MNFRNQQRASHRAQKEWLRSGLRRHDAPVLAGHWGRAWSSSPVTIASSAATRWSAW